MAQVAGYEKAYSQGVVEGSRLGHYRLRRMKIALTATITVALVGFGFAWQHDPGPPKPVELIVHIAPPVDVTTVSTGDDG